MRYDAIILAGGAGSRLGGADKARLELLGAPLIARPLQAVSAADRIVLVGPDDLHHLWPRYLHPEAMKQGHEPAANRVVVAREDPPGGGPAAGTAAGVRALDSAGDESHAPWVLLLSCDLPMAEAGVRRLVDAAEAGTTDRERAIARSAGSRAAQFGGGEPSAPDGYCLIDSGGRTQWMFGIYRAAALRSAVAALSRPDGASMRQLLGALNLVPVPDLDGVSADVDTWDDHSAWTARLGGSDERAD